MTERVENKVHAYRKHLGVTQEEIARHIGVTRQTVIAIERGNYTPSVLLAIKIARYFKSSVEDVFIYTYEK